MALCLQALAQAEAHAARINLEQRLAAATREARGAREENAALREQLGKLLEEAAAGRAATDGALSPPPLMGAMRQGRVAVACISHGVFSIGAVPHFIYLRQWHGADCIVCFARKERAWGQAIRLQSGSHEPALCVQGASCSN